jgi:hypothetical protein
MDSGHAAPWGPVATEVATAADGAVRALVSAKAAAWADAVSATDGNSVWDAF